MSTNQETMLALLDRAYNEGVIDKEDAVKKAYQQGVSDTLASMNMTPATEEESEIPTHNIESLSTKAFFDETNPEGYKKGDYSKIWPSLLSTDVDSGRAEMNYPYCVYGKGDKVVVTCNDEQQQTILPYKECFAIYCLTPNKTYQWTMYSGTKVLKSGSFKTTGRVRWMKTPSVKYPHNLRDIGCPKELVSEGCGIAYGRIYRSEGPDKVEVGSADHIYLRDQLGITVQLNLRDASKSSDAARNDLFETTYSYNIPAYSEAITGSTDSKTLFRQAFEALVGELEKGKNVLVNCWQGRDRTGTFCWLVQSLCYMKIGYTEAHWELSSFDRCENSKIWNIEEASNGELMTFITKLQSKIKDTTKRNDSYTLAYYFAHDILGVADERIKKLQSIMVAKI